MAFARGFGEAGCVVVLPLMFCIGVASAGQITNYTTPGNLKVTHDLGCISFEEIHDEYTPPDLMNSYDKCIAAKRYDDATVVWIVAGTYAYFDARRVDDATSHDAFQVLMLEHHPGPEDAPKLKEALAKYATRGTGPIPALCAKIKRLGPPDYHPDYMINHGMGAIFGGVAKGGVSATFDAKKGWRDTVEQYLHCDVSDMN